ncbi:MAG: hypothetical protein ACREHD_03220, partial [Pirellulales bacterium]
DDEQRGGGIAPASKWRRPVANRPRKVKKLARRDVSVYCWYMKRIAFPKNPDADALVAAWIVAHYLFDDESCAVVFVDGKRLVADLPPVDCAVGNWGSHDPFCVSFNAGSRVRTERGETCITRSVWEYLVAQGRQLEHLVKLVAVVEEGKNNAGSPSEALQASQTNGLHAFVRQQIALVPDDHALFRTVCRWLHRYECAAWRSCMRRSSPVLAGQVGH